ncbi:MAG TPA: carboxypeptidase-like regulatory domain-containing protein [Kofleriaceae bacterium]
MSGMMSIDGVTAIRDRDGSFEVEAPECGMFDVVVGGPGFARRMISGVQIDGPTNLGRIDVASGHVVHGRVTDAAGQPLPNVPVRIESRRTQSTDPLVRLIDGDYETVTDRDGAYELGGVSVIDLGLRPRISAGVAGQLSSGAFRFPDQDAVVNLIALPVGSVFGDVAPTQQPTPHLVFLRSITNRSLGMAAIANAGRFEFDDVPIGDYDAFDDLLAKATKRISVTAGSTVNVSFP